MECRDREEEWKYVETVVLSQSGVEPVSNRPCWDVAASSKPKDKEEGNG
jgi:hypothetical protein